MSSAEAGMARVTLSRRSLVRGLSLLLAVAPALAACGSGGFRPLYGDDAFRRGSAGAPGAARLRADPGPRRPAHPQRADLPEHRRRRAAPPTHRLEVSISESVHLHAGQDRRRRAGPGLFGAGIFRLIDIKDKKVVLPGASHAPRRLRALPVDLLQRARPRGRREPRRAHRRRRSQDAGGGLSVRREA